METTRSRLTLNKKVVNNHEVELDASSEESADELDANFQEETVIFF